MFIFYENRRRTRFELSEGKVIIVIIIIIIFKVKGVMYGFKLNPFYCYGYLKNTISTLSGVYSSSQNSHLTTPSEMLKKQKRRMSERLFQFR